MAYRRHHLAATALASALVAVSLTGCLAGEDFVENSAELENAESKSGKRDPVVFVHGCTPPFFTNQMSADLWNPMIDDFLSRGYPEDFLFNLVFSGAPCESIEAHAAEVAELVNEARAATGKSKVDLVAHSMGGLVVRYYVRHGGRHFVRDIVTLAGAHHGGEGAAAGVELQEMFGFPAYEGEKEMYPPYACEGETSGGANDIQFELNGCLTPTGRTVWRDETPFEDKGIRYLSIRNTLDEIVLPVEAACLDQRRQNDCSDSSNLAVTVPPGPGPCGPMDCPAHVTLMLDPGVMQTTFSFLNSH